MELLLILRHLNWYFLEETIRHNLICIIVIVWISDSWENILNLTVPKPLILRHNTDY